MKKILFSFLILLAIHSPSSMALIPNQILIIEHWISLTKSYDIRTSEQKLGSLYRRFLTYPLTYDFFDPYDIKTASAKARFFSWGAHLDIYDQSNAFIGSVKEKIFTILPSFELYSKDNATKLIQAQMNFWGTKFYIYDPLTQENMAIMTRPYFRAKNDWVIDITNSSLLEQKNIDTRVLFTVVATQGEIEDWEKKDKEFANSANKDNFTEFTQKFLKEVNSLEDKNQPSTSSTDKVIPKDLEALIEELEISYSKVHPRNPNESDSERLQSFYRYYLELLQSGQVTPEQKKKILFLLNSRLASFK